MKLKSIVASVAVFGGSLLVASPVMAKMAADQIAQLDGPKLTCLGAERAGSASGIPEYSGKWVGKWPGMKAEYGYEPGPYADEKPTLTITSKNADQYADKLTDGMKVMLKKYPNAFRMNVYPSHRDFGPEQWHCDATKKNAASSVLVDDGRGVTGVGGGVGFPIPQNGLEAIWNTTMSPRPYTEKAVTDIANVYGNGSIGWGRNKFMTMNNTQNPKNPGSFEEKINSYFYTGYLLPERDKGFIAVGFQPNNFAKDSTQAWQYLPGTRRVRQAPEIGFDYPVPPAGMHTVDDDYGFNGSPERYTWKLVGKKEMYVPYNNFKINDPALKYAQIIKPSTPNPDFLRYELHRVWVLEANLKPGVRHIYKKRFLYIDEDTWQVLWADNFDGRDQLWRVAMITYHYSQESSTLHRGVSVYHDLTSGGYEANYLVNERGTKDWWRINTPMTPALFTPEAASRGGH